MTPPTIAPRLLELGLSALAPGVEPRVDESPVDEAEDEDDGNDEDPETGAAVVQELLPIEADDDCELVGVGVGVWELEPVFLITDEDGVETGEALLADGAGTDVALDVSENVLAALAA